MGMLHSGVRLRCGLPGPAWPWLLRGLLSGVLAGVLVTPLAAQQERAQRAGDKAVRLDGLAAVVGGDGPGPGVDVILRSDVELRARISLSGRTTGSLPTGPVPAGLLRATLEEIIGEHLIAREARRVQAASPSGEDVARERRRLVRSAGGTQRLEALLTALSARAEELDVVAERRALVAAFLNANLEGASIVTASELERAYSSWLSQHGTGTGEAPAAVKARLQARLSREGLARTIERWVGVLRTRMPVRVYASFAPGF